jgi:hypothetical protein
LHFDALLLAILQQVESFSCGCFAVMNLLNGELGKDGNLAFSPNKSSKGVVAIVE